jgi:PhzF family phenazine biosynthesis protein
LPAPARPVKHGSVPVYDARLYAAFAAEPFGGNIAGVVYDDDSLTPELMQRLAADLGAPTTGFVRDLGGDGFGVRFFGPTAEMAMCGHVTVGVFAALADDGRVEEGAYRQVTASGDVSVVVERGPAGIRVTMRQPQPRFDLFDVPPREIAPLLGVSPGDVASVGSAGTGLRHLFVEVDGLAPLARLRTDDHGLRDLCREVGIDTVGVYTRLDPDGGGADLRVRDLCHGIGDPEEAASGTTNGALAAHLWRRGQLAPPDAGARIVVRTEQGFEMGRPSLITTELHVASDRVEAVRVGGTATRRLAGQLFT